MVVIIVTLLLCFIAGIANSLMDLSSENRFKKDWYNKGKSWKYKWKDPLTPGRTHWYHFGMIPKYEERFIYSSTLFVAYTDFWHLMQAVMLSCFSLAIALNVVIVDFDLVFWEILVNFFLIRLAFGIGFEPLYKWMKGKLDAVKYK